MTTLPPLAISRYDSGYLRQFNARHDLERVADLIEMCFSETLDPDGRRYLKQMRNTALNRTSLDLTRAMPQSSSMPHYGFVWEEQGAIIGNLSLIPYLYQRRRIYLIANVAVHPDYRRQGIARRLTSHAVEFARQRGVQAIWLHVRAENQPAINLYQSLGFGEQARRTTWVCEPGGQTDPLLEPGISARSSLPVYIQIRNGLHADWYEQRQWLERRYPLAIQWYLSMQIAGMRPGFWGTLYRVWNDIHIRQWSAWSGQRNLGLLIWQSTPQYADNLWMGSHSDRDEEALSALLVHARRVVSPRRPLSLDYPAGLAAPAIQAAGFHAHQTLIWMSQLLPGSSPRQ